ncbi:AAA family ATPase [Wolbachia endosymbiont of Drosophila pseudotakahashii]|uniref:AAA family ATPase n=1 Tax=Wolbachia endosymbiont of Drosophila pseudotakahashii TaxID=375919 RepID=UPI002256F214|nr:AAA family ATPase [Wolbachia endosymbiont of Drosophila pseudotakahashii]MCX3065283.1 AAA family ATPase [Wolbachia endosymbiont of Drosophila pseudotakahashii]
MADLYNKANAPYLIAGALATLVLLASGTLAVAPYVEFLSSVAAFNVALPVALSLSILSVLVLVLSCKMISQNKKLDAQKAEPNEKNGLAKEQENIIQSSEPQIKELNKRLSSQYNEIEKLIASAAKEEELNKLNNEVKELKVKIASAATERKTQEKIFMKFYAKGEKRGKKAFEDFIFKKEIKTKLVNIYESIKNNINIVSSAKSGDSEEEQEKIQRGFIFHGPGGAGKSSIVEAIGDQLISLTTFIKVSGADLLEKSNINELFNKANENAPCIVLIDEIDSFGKGRTDANRVPLNYFFTRFDEADKGVTVFATTNVSLQGLDASLVSGSCLSSKLKFTMIEGSILKNILKDGLNEKLKNKKYKHAISRILNETRLTTLSLSAADVKCLINYIVEKLNNKIGTSAYAIIKDFCIKYNIGEVSNKQTNRKIENSIGESQQYTSRPSHKLNDALCDSGYTSMFYPNQ